MSFVRRQFGNEGSHVQPGKVRFAALRPMAASLARPQVFTEDKIDLLRKYIGEGDVVIDVGPTWLIRLCRMLLLPGEQEE